MYLLVGKLRTIREEASKSEMNLKILKFIEK